jgi:hypothetical protein
MTRPLTGVLHPVYREATVRISIALPESAVEALARRAVRDLRPTKLEIVHLVTEALRESGDLPAEDPGS